MELSFRKNKTKVNIVTAAPTDMLSDGVKNYSYVFFFLIKRRRNYVIGIKEPEKRFLKWEYLNTYK